jgi:Reverse transcriptase (RNA-dependent DNA polymerase)
MLSPLSNEETQSAYLTEILSPTDPRQDNQKFIEAKEKEIAGLVERGTWKAVLKSEIPPDANILRGRFVLTIKVAGTDKELFKARYVARGFNDIGKARPIHDSPVSKAESTRMILSLAAIFGFRVSSADVTQAYIQSAHNLTRDVFLDPEGVIELPADHVLKLLKPLSGLCDAGDHWARTYRELLKEDLKLKPTVSDPALFFKAIGERLEGLYATYVDDLLTAGTPGFLVRTTLTERKFESKPRRYDNVTYVVVDIQADNHLFHANMNKYIDNVQPLDDDKVTFKDFAGLRAKLLWVSTVRPYILCAVSLATQGAPDTFTRIEVSKLNKVLAHAKSHKELQLSYPPLDKDSLRVVVHSDASFAGNRDMSTQIGYIVFLADSHNICHVLKFSSTKSRRIVR